jgi:hypothetical protein
MNLNASRLSEVVQLNVLVDERSDAVAIDPIRLSALPKYTSKPSAHSDL